MRTRLFSLGWHNLRTPLPTALVAMFVLGTALVLAGCDLFLDKIDGSDRSDAIEVEVTGGGPVLQVLPGPAVFAEEAAGTIEMFPPKLQERFRKVAEMGPFSNNTAEISGSISVTMSDGGESGDAVTGAAEFQTQDGTNWRFEFDRVNPNGSPPHAPHFGGVVTDFVFHGPTGLHTPLMPLVQTEASMWGFARVFRNGELVNDKAPFHLMLTSQTRGEDFDYLCYTCSPTTQSMEQVHLISRSPEGPLYDAPGGFLHITWQKSSFQRTDPR